jgi:YHS domain-containing protein
MVDTLELVKDPVCGMMVEPGEREAVHDGLRYAFCSYQCRERFIAKPGLYVGARRKLAPKQRGVKLIRQRRIRLHQALAQEQATELAAALREMMGVVQVRYVGPEPTDSQAGLGFGINVAGEIDITYDLLQATVTQFERRIAEFGAQLRCGVGDRLIRDFINYFEECELEDVEAATSLPRRERKRRRAGLQTCG